MISLVKAFASRDAARRKIIGLANDALNVSKRAIFSLHRGDTTVAEQKLKEAEERLKACDALIKKEPGLAYEGSFVAALEEHTEAQLLAEYLKRGQWSRPRRAQRLDVLIGGLSDFTGELVRYAVKEATKGNHRAVTKAHQEVESVVGILLELDLTGNLRQKFDQAKRNLRQMEQIAYELSLRA